MIGDNYDKLLARYRKEVIDHEEEKVRILYLYRQQMITTAQIHSELEIARETIATLLSGKSVDNYKVTV